MRPFPSLLVMAAAGVSVCACATLEDPANAPTSLPLAERAGVPGVVHSGVIAPAGAAIFPAGPVGAGETLITLPFRYRHTAVLTEDVVGYSFTVSGVQAPAGAPGYYAGTFQSTGTYASGGMSELWCFMPGAVGGERQHLCFLKNLPGLAAIAPTRMNPFLWTEFAPATGTFDYVRTPIYAQRAVDIPADLVLAYKFRGWSSGAARLTEYAVGREVRSFDAPRGADGVAILRTVAGDIALSPAPGAPGKVVVSLR